MSDEVDAAARRYSRDMRRIREHRNVSIEDVHEETRIAQTLIESFEDSSLYDHSTFNRIYLRSFIRVYAEAIEFPPDEALEALDAALEGTYEGELSDRYLGEGAEGIEESLESEDSSNSPSKGEQKETDASESGSSDSVRDSTPPAGGLDGRGGIVGPARAIEPEDEGPQQEEDGDPEPDEPLSPDSEDDSLSAEGEAHPREPSSEPFTSDDDPYSSSVLEEDDEGSDSVDRERDDTTQSFSQEDAPEEPIGPGSAIGPVRELDADDESDAPDEDESHESHPKEPSRESDFSSSSPPDAEEEVDSSLEGGVSGIVGGPKELGSSSEEPTAPDDSESSSLGTSRPPEPPRQTSSQQSKNRKRRKILFSGLGVLVLIGVLAGLTLYYSSGESSNEAPDVSTTSEDTSEAVAVQDTSADTTPTQQRPSASLSIGDTVAVTVVAESDLSEIRIQRDGDLRRPYWIEEDSAAVFPFTSRITFENDLDDARFFIEQYPYPSPERDEQGRVVIDRNTLEAFSDTLRGEPQSLSVSPDTVPIGSPEGL